MCASVCESETADHVRVVQPEQQLHLIRDFGFLVWGLEFGVWGLKFGAWGLGSGVWGLGFGV